ncbi:MAG TPA: hypothetical protein VFX12_01325 [Vicinamibacterales bacterium]|nr:hypothetical protein [Vicinamibacterales bacterium]
MTSYRRGVACERRARLALEAAGHFVVRAAGSRGAVDLLAVHPSGRVRAVQVKRGAGRVTAAERVRLQALAAWLPAVSVELWRYAPRVRHPVIEQW